MRIQWTCLLLATLFAGNAKPLFAEAPVYEFVEGLRNRGYYDTVEDYLDRVEKDPRISAEVKKRVPYERAITLRRSIGSIKSAKLQHKELDRAAAYLEQFLKANPTHPLAGNAKTVRGDIFIGKAEVINNELQGPGGGDKKETLRKQALDNIGKARAEFKSALPQFEAHLKSFGTYIPPDQRERRRQRQLAEARFISTQINLAKCTYTEAHSYDRKDIQFDALLTKAFKEFEAIHGRYRSLGWGLYARMWQGKCFEEQGEIGRALGIYGELLAHKGKSSLMATIQREALYFKLICLNHDKKKDYQLVEIAATEWWKRNARYRTTATGLGLKYELARARKILGTVVEEIPPSDKAKYLTLAKTDAEFVAKYAGKHKLQAAILLEQIKRLRGDKTVDPRNFADAFTSAMVVYQNIAPQLKAYNSARNAGKPQAELDKLKTVLKNEVDETARLHQLTQRLYQTGDDVNRLNNSRYYSAYAAYLHDQYFGMHDRVYDGAVLAEFVSRHAKEDNPDQALDAAYLAMALYIRAYNQAPEGQRQAEIRWILKTGKYLVANWPGSKSASEASLNIGKLHDKREEPLAAARWYSRVPPASKIYYAQAQILAGRAYWNQYIIAAGLKPDRATHLAELRKKTDADLVDGVANLLNPSWRSRQSLERERRDLLAALSKSKQQPANSKQQPAGKKPPAKKPAKPAAKKKPKSAPPQKTSPQIADLDRRILEIKNKSVAELKAALTALPGITPGSFAAFPEPELRNTLLKQLKTLSEVELRRRHETGLAALLPEQLKDFFNADLDDWKEASARHLTIGTEKLAAELPEKDPSADDLTDLISAKVTLAHYYQTRGAYRNVIGLLTEEPHSVLKAIAVDDESTRPATGIKGRPFAGEVYQVLLRAYVGTQNIDAALKAMDALEKAIGADKAENITDIYEDLGKQLQKEIERLRNRDDKERLSEVRESFKRFLAELFKRKNSLKYSTLMWIAETYFSLGEGMGDDPDAATYYEKAFGAYNQILDEPALDDARKTTVKLRQLVCQRRQQEYAAAIKTATEILAKKPMLIRAQFEASYALQHWAKSGEHAKYMDAINGIKETAIWGWAGAGRKLRSLLDRTDLDPPERANYEQKFLEARYNMAQCRLQYALSLSSDKTDKKRQAALRHTLAELSDFATGFGVIDDKTFKDDTTSRIVKAKGRFDAIFETTQLEMGRGGDQLVKIDWPKPQPKVAASKPTDPKTPTGSETEIASTPKNTKKKKKAEAGVGWGAIIGGVLLGLMLFAGGGWFLMNMSKQNKNRRNLYADLGSSTFTPPPAVQPSRSATNPQPRAGQVDPAARKKAQQRAAAGAKRPAKGGASSAKRPPKPTS